jgi:hypothetical protein
MPSAANRIACDCLLRAPTIGRIPPSLLAPIGLVVVAIGLALIHFGADLTGGLAANQSGLVSSLAQAICFPERPIAIPRSERDDEA